MTSDRRAARGGFTLVELMIVIGIIAFLAAVLIVAAGPLIGSSKQKATQATLAKIDQLLAKRMDAFHRMAERQLRLNPNSVDYVLGFKTAMRTALPQSLNEYRLYCSKGANPPGFNRPPGSPDPDPKTESSEMLYLALTKGAIFGIEAVDSDAFSSSEVTDTDQDGLMEFVDAWQQPLRFYRWPTRLIRPAPSGSEGMSQSISGAGYTFPITVGLQSTGAPTPAFAVFGPMSPPPFGLTGSRGSGAQRQYELQDPLAQDADDPRGRLSPDLTSGNLHLPPGLQFRTPAGTMIVVPQTGLVSAAQYEAAFHTPDTYHVLLVVSAGADRQLGLFEPNDVTNFGHLAQPVMSDTTFADVTDNLSNVKIQAGGK